MKWSDVLAALMEREATYDPFEHRWTCPMCGKQTLRVESDGGLGIMRLVCEGRPNIDVGPPSTWPAFIPDAA